MFNIGLPELILIVVVALIVFGPKRLPEIGKAIGKSFREFKQAMEGIKNLQKEGKDKENKKGGEIE